MKGSGLERHTGANTGAREESRNPGSLQPGGASSGSLSLQLRCVRYPNRCLGLQAERLSHMDFRKDLSFSDSLCRALYLLLEGP